VAKVDRRQPFTQTGTAGSIANDVGVMVGAKKADPLDDVFAGTMDYVSIEIAQPATAQ
jgi:hypothetical protein